MAEPPAHQVKVVFTTTHDDLQLPETKRQLLVPADIKRYGLSRILNSSSMLATAAPIPLDFLVAGAFLRTSLAEYLAQHGLSAETTVTLTYVRSLLPPAFEAALPHEDWVSCVDVLSATSRAGAEWTLAEDLAGRPLRERILSASYDGLVRVWDGGGRVLAASAAGVHSRRLNAARFLSARTIVSAGADQKIVVWDYGEDEAGLAGRLRPALELVGHGHMIHSLDVKRDFDGTRRILSACADGSIGLWAASKRGAPPPPPAADLSGGPLPAKRAKLSASTPSAPQHGPLAMMTAVHSEPATAAVFDPADPTRAYSVSHDHTLRTLDLETGRVVSTLSTLHPLLCAACLPGGSSRLVAAGSSARHVSLLDTREASSAVAALTLRGHANMVSSVAAGPQAGGGGGGDGGHALVSGSHDGTCKVWDLRSVRPGRADEGGGSVAEPVYSVEREWLRSKGKRAATAGQGAKVLTVVWDGYWGIVSGGEDRTVQVDRGREHGMGG